MDVVDEVAVEAPAPQPDGVQSAVGSRVAGHKAEGQDVLREACAAAHHRVAAHAAELVHQHVGAQDGVVVDDNLAGQLGAVADDDAVADKRIVGHMHALHEQVARAYDGAALGCRATVDGHVLANLIVVAYLCRALFAPELEVLGNSADDCTREEDVAVADACAVEHRHTVHQRVVVADDNAFVNVAEGTDLAVLAYDGFGVYVCQWTYHVVKR